MKGYVNGPFGQVHFERAGGPEGTTLFCLHQTPVCGDMFQQAFIPLAEKGITAVAIDTPGYGASDPPEDGVTIADYADAIAAAINQIQDGAAALLGHHTGASIAVNIAARYPEKISRLILNGVALLNDEERAFFAKFDFKPLLPQVDGSHLVASWEQRLAASPGWSNVEAMHRHVVSMLRVNERYHYGFKAAFEQDLESDLMAVHCPTMILTNSGDDLFKASQRAAALRPDFEYRALEGGTHDIVDEQPEAWASAVASFVK